METPQPLSRSPPPSAPPTHTLIVGSPATFHMLKDVVFLTSVTVLTSGQDTLKQLKSHKNLVETSLP